MSMEDFINRELQIEHIKQSIQQWNAEVDVVVLVLSNIWTSNVEYSNQPIALFSTREKAEQYVKDCMLPMPMHTVHPGYNGSERKMSRTFRPDSPLWNFNPSAFDRPSIMTPVHGVGMLDLPRDPVAPTGPVPEVPNATL